MKLTLCNGKEYELPLFDPLVATHVKASHSLVQTLIDQINKEKMYDRFFDGKTDLTFLDIGANIGLVSIYAAPACKRIVAVEPSPETYQELLSLTLPFKQIEPIQFALTKQNSESDFYVNDINSTASSTVNTYGKKISVFGLSLHSILNIYQLEHVDVCKVDAEGGEGEALNHGELEMASNVIQSYYIECHNCPKSTWQDKMAQITGGLALAGYSKIEVSGMSIIASK